MVRVLAMRLSIIIPVLNEAGHIGNTLRLLQPLREQGHELILVDGGSSDDPLHIAQPLVDQVQISPLGRARQMNAGADIASGDWLLFLHADTQLPSASVEVITNALHGHGDQWGRFDVRLSGEGWLLRVVERTINWRSRLSGIATGDQAVFVKREVFEQLGGYAEVPLMEDIELSKRLKRISRPVCIRQPVITSSRRWEENGVCSTILLMWWLRLLFFVGVSPDRLVQRYYKRTDSGSVSTEVDKA